MIRRHLTSLRAGLMVLDGVIAVAVFVGVATIRFADGGLRTLLGALGNVPLWLAALVFAVIWVVALWLSGLYRLEVRWRIWTEVGDLVRATLVVLALTLSTLFIVKGTDVSRLFLAFLFVAQPVATLASRVIMRRLFEVRRRAGIDPRYMLVVGTGALAQDFADRVERHANLGIEIIGHLAAPGEGEPVVRRPILGAIEAIEDILHSRVVDEVAICLPPNASQYLEAIAGLAAGEGKTVRLAVHPVEEILPGAVQEEFDGILVRSIAHDGHRELGLLFKRAIDIVGSVLGLVILSPLLIGAAIAVRLTDGSPILFGQERVGLHGRPFTMLKFRSMVVDAEAKLDDLMHLNERSGAAFKMEDDPRITPVGRFLRRTSIDELPQLWNVLTGSMSLVGPRPPLPREVAEYDIWHRRRLSMKPGITGLWQIEARHEPDFDRWVEHDLLYIDGWSIWLDFKIMVRTIPAMLSHSSGQ
jgi:exopolysaccharide biosynthesis polyprenyl glycosylphosphotransferase